MATKSGFDVVCVGCEYRELSYSAKAEDYGEDGVGWYCNKEEWGVERCPRREQWREWFKNHPNKETVWK